MSETLTERDDLRGVSEEAYGRFTETLTRVEAMLEEIRSEIDRMTAEQRQHRSKLYELADDLGIDLGDIGD